ncbi:hypothetical protein 18India_26 [Salmonella phage 18-India]|nr:hypothetical protein 18India_26 [Salmonella phage 18-India]
MLYGVDENFRTELQKVIAIFEKLGCQDKDEHHPVSDAPPS